MSHPLVAQLRFSRSEWQRALAGVSDADARRRLEPMNCISWMIAHLAWHEQLYWLERAQDKVILPDLAALVGSGLTQFMGRFGDEATLFRLAAQLESARPGATRWPPVSA